MKNIRGQHYVWRYYLEAWAEKGNFHCLRDKKVISVKPINIAKERDFYRLREMTPEDISFIERFAIEPAPKHLQNLHRNLLDNFYTITRLKSAIDYNFSNNLGYKKEIDIAVNNAEELLHGRIENAAQIYLNKLRNGDASFFPEEKSLPCFLYFLCVQHFRTKGVKSSIFNMQQQRGLNDFKRIWNVVSHIFAANVGWSIYAERYQHRILILENNTTVPFLTGDQPTINIHSREKGVAPDRLAFYYPLSPKRAMLLIDEVQGTNPTHMHLSNIEVEHYNNLIINAAHEMVFSCSCEQLKTIHNQN